MFGVVGFRGDDTPYFVHPVHVIVFDLHEDGGERFYHGSDVGVHRLVIEGYDFFARLLKGERYLFGCSHFLWWTVRGGIVVRDKIT